MKGLDPVELEMLDDACVVLTEEERTFDDEGTCACSPSEQAAADRLKARGLAVEDDVSECLQITARGRVALMCHHAAASTVVA